MPTERCWFCERAAWPIVRERLALQGCKFTGIEAGEREEERHEQQPVEVRSAVKSWYKQLALKYHPDRMLDNGAAMRVVNDAYEQLRELLGVTR